jgi:hypothetical protein
MVASGCLGGGHHTASRLEVTVRIATSPADTATGRVAFRTQHYSLTCGRPPAGTLPNPTGACTAIADLELPHNRTACRRPARPVMGSVVVSGSFRGKPIHLRLTTEGWCGASADLRRDYAALLLPDPAIVPDVVGLPVLQAAAVLQRAGFTVSVATSMTFGSLAPMPLAKGESAAAGVLAERGTDVALTFRSRCCMSSPVGTTGRDRMPRLIGLDARQAIDRLRQAGLNWVIRLRPVDAATGPILDSALVVQQLPEPGAALVRGNGGVTVPQLTVDYGQSSGG